MEKCRLCYINSNPAMCQHIFNAKFEPPIWEIIKQLSNLMITKNDPYTKSICGQCFQDLIKYSAFRQKILDTDYRIQYEKEQLSESTSDNCDYFETPCTPATTDSDDFIIKEEEIEIEEHPLEIKDGINENLDNSTVVVIDNQNIEKLSSLSDIIINNDKITTCSSNCTSLNDNRNDTNESQSSTDFNNDNDVITVDENEKSGAEDVATSKSLNDKSSDDINGKKAELNVEMNPNTKHSQSLDVGNSVNTKTETTDKVTESTKRRRNARNDLNIDLTVQTNERELRSSSRTQTVEGLLTCNICQKQFVFKSHLNTHLIMHTGETPHKCIVCERFFESREAVKRHIRVHTGEKPYLCTICDEAFPFKQGLTIHLKTHINEKELIRCDVCGKQFIREHNLDVHMRVHTGEKPYKCKVCNEAFALNCNLKQHYRQMHKKS